ncbi:MAG: hypothetical protein JWQ38_2688 [Flavipsychrobacter sp.]|nr:hypothetical protein [Flavipsychrobacter sp.]
MTLKFDRKDRVFIGVVALVHVVFFLLACCYKRIYMGDSFEYIYEALNIKQYSFFYSGNPALPIEPEYMTQRQPLYPLFLLGVYLFTVNNWIVIFLQNILSVVNIYYSRKVLARLGYDKKYDWLLLLLVLAYPSQFINANTVAPDILLQTFTLLYFGSCVSFFQKKDIKYAVWMSLALIAGMMVKPVLYPFVLVHVLIVIIIAVMQKVKMQRPVLIAVVPLCAAMLYSYSNYLRTDKFHFTSNQSFNAIFYYYTWYSHKDGTDSASSFLAHERSVINAIPEYRDRYDYGNERGMQLLKANFIPYMAFHLKNSARMFIEPGKAEIDLFTGKLTYGRLYNKEQTGFFATYKKEGLSGMGTYVCNNPSMPLVIVVLLFNLLRLVGFVVFLFKRNIHWVVRSFVFVLVAYFAVAAGPIANTRYFLPVSLIVIGCAVMGLMNKKDKTVYG